MEPIPTRWFELSLRELKVLLCAVIVILLALGGVRAWQKATHSEEFKVLNAPETLPRPKKININTAPSHQLQFLPGIGENYAERIIEYRENKGPFESLDCLIDIQGIGPATVDQIKPMAVCKVEE